jgi:hypothetical protein
MVMNVVRYKGSWPVFYISHPTPNLKMEAKLISETLVCA